jgi:hypothetical protein
MDINDIHVDRAMLETLVNPLHDTMSQRGYPESIHAQIKLVQFETNRLLSDLNGLVATLQNPPAPGMPRVVE